MKRFSFLLFQERGVGFFLFFIFFFCGKKRFNLDIKPVASKRFLVVFVEVCTPIVDRYEWFCSFLFRRYANNYERFDLLAILSRIFSMPTFVDFIVYCLGGVIDRFVVA